MNKPTPTRHGAWRRLPDGTLIDESALPSTDASTMTTPPTAGEPAVGTDDAVAETTSTPVQGRKTKTRE